MQNAGAFSKGAALMKLSLSALALIAAAVTLATPAHAQNYPWCALYSGGGVGGGTNCGFVSFEQCMATASGLGKFCVRNTQYVPPLGPHPLRRYRYPY
ncbi:MAG: DUF3551 domain-containing protein [Xanthobacteraceae bacterium]